MLEKINRYWQKGCGLLLLLFLVFLPQLAFAADSSSAVSGKIADLFSVPPYDWSMTFLRSFFGHVGPVLAGTTTSIIGNFFGIFNAGLLTLVAAVMSYTVVHGIFATAHEGEAMGKKFSAGNFVRTALGIIALVPKFSGYSLIQVILMWAVVQGVGFADHAWNAAMTYLNQGGVIYMTPAAVQKHFNWSLIDTTLIDNEQKDAASLGSGDVMRSLVCVHALNKFVVEKQTEIKKDMQINPQNYYQSGTTQYAKFVNQLNTSYTFHTQFDDDASLAFLPGFNKDEQLPDFLANITTKKDLSGICGVYSYYVQPSSSNSAYAGAGVKDYIAAKRAGLEQMITDLDRLAAQVVNDAYAGKELQTTANESKAFDLVNAAGNYQTIIFPARLFAGQSYLEQSGLDYEKAKSSGWATAGSYYYNIMALTNVQGELDTASFRLVVAGNFYPPSSPTAYVPGSAERQDGFLKLQTYFTDTLHWQDGFNKLIPAFNYSDDEILPAIDLATKANSNITKEIQQTNIPDLSNSNFIPITDLKISDDSLVGNTYLGWFMEHTINYNQFTHMDDMFTAMATEVNNVIQSFYDNLVNTNENAPIANLRAFGADTLAWTVNYWSSIFNNVLQKGLIVFNVNTALTITAGVTSGLSFVLGKIATVLNVILGVGYFLVKFYLILFAAALPLGIAISIPLFVNGLILSVFVPLLPYLLFTFGVISWLIFIIEAMTALPLVALGMTHPYRHDYMTSAEQALMLAFSVFLRPICMIIGLIVGIVLSFVGMEIVNAGFAWIVNTILGRAVTAGLGASVPSTVPVPTVTLIEELGVLIVYTFIVLAIINRCFSLIYVIPAVIMRWLGLARERTSDEKLLEGIRGGLKTFAQAGATGVGDTVDYGRELFGIDHHKLYGGRSKSEKKEKKKDDKDDKDKNDKTKVEESKSQQSDNQPPAEETQEGMQGVEESADAAGNVANTAEESVQATSQGVGEGLEAGGQAVGEGVQVGAEGAAEGTAAAAEAGAGTLATAASTITAAVSTVVSAVVSAVTTVIEVVASAVAAIF